MFVYDNRNEKNYLFITYDTKKKSIVATLYCFEVNRFGNPEKKSYSFLGIDAVNSAIKNFVECRSSNLQDLISRNKIRFGKNAENYLLPIYRNDSIQMKGSRRNSHNKTYDESETHVKENKDMSSKPPVKGGNTVSEPPVTETRTVTSSPKDDTVIEENSSIHEFINKVDAVAMIMKLNPGVEIAIGREYDYILSSVPGDKLVLPEGFEYNDKNGITNKHHTETGAYITIGVLPLFREKNDENKEDHSTEEKTDEVKSTDKKEEETTVVEEVYEPRSEGKLKTKVKNKVKNLKINWKTVKKVLIGSGIAIVVITLASALKGGNKNKNNNNNNNLEKYHFLYKDDGSVPTSYNTEEEIIYADPLPEDSYEPSYADPLPEDTNDIYDEVREVPFEEPVYADPIETDYTYEAPYVEPTVDSYETPSGNTEEQLDDILQIAYRNIGDIYQFLNGGSLSESMQTCDLEKYASDNDRDAIRTILNARDYVIRNAYTDRNVPLTLSDVYRFLDNYVNYAFEGSTMFDGQTIKAYDYLDPNSQYIVTAMGEAMLQLYPGYEYESSTSHYSYGELVEKVANEHGETADSFTNGRGY